LRVYPAHACQITDFFPGTEADYHHLGRSKTGVRRTVTKTRIHCEVGCSLYQPTPQEKPLCP
jgi:hypothetical protein